MSHSQLNQLVAKHFEIPAHLEEDQLRSILIHTFDELIANDFQKLLQILYRADVDQDKLKDLLENTVEKTSAAIIADAYLERQKKKIDTWNRFSTKP